MQLVELQRTAHDPEGERVAVFAISYDPVSVLADFAAAHGITYSLLSDEGSVVIERLGLVNAQIVEERAFWGRVTEERHRGLPYPGTFLLDDDGVVIERYFERSHRIRPGGPLLADRLGLSAAELIATVVGQGPALTMAVRPDAVECFPNQVQRLHVRVVVEDGFHVYVPSNPPGFVDLALTFDAPQGVFFDAVPAISGHPFRVEGLPDEFSVAEGTIDMEIPFYLLEDTGRATIRVRLDYQACDSSICLTPDAVEVSFDLTELPRP